MSAAGQEISGGRRQGPWFSPQQLSYTTTPDIDARAQALFLPEASDYIARSGEETVSLVKPVQTSEFVLGLREEARRQELPIHVGVHEPGDEPGKVKNTVLWIDEKGDITHRYQKIHLFDVQLKDGPVLEESKSVN